MRAKDIKIGERYKFKAHPHIGYAKALEVLGPKQGINTNTFIVVKCEHTVNPNDLIGFIKYFKPCDLIRY